MDKFTFNIVMAFLMIGGFVNSLVAMPSTLVIGVYGIIGNIAGLVYFIIKAVKSFKNHNK